MTTYTSLNDVPGFSFGRASQAARWTSDSLLEVVAQNLPRLDHDPATGDPLGLLMEPARQRLCSLSGPYQMESSASATDYTPVPVLGLFPTAYRIAGANAASRARATIQGGVVQGQQYAVTWVFMFGTSGRARIGCDQFSSPFAGSIFSGTQAEFVDGADPGDGAGNLSPLRVRVVGDVYIVTSVWTPNFTGGARVSLGPSGAAGEDVIVISTQVELVDVDNPYATSFVPGASSTGDRAAETLVVSPVGGRLLGVDDWSAVSLLVRARAPEDASAERVLFEVDDGTEDNRIRVARGEDGALFLSDAVAGSTTPVVLGTVDDGEEFTLGVVWSPEGRRWSLNGAAVVAEAAVAPPSTPAEARLLGTRMGAAHSWYRGHVRRVAVFPRALNDAELASLQSQL